MKNTISKAQLLKEKYDIEFGILIKDVQVLT